MRRAPIAGLSLLQQMRRGRGRMLNFFKNRFFRTTFLSYVGVMGTLFLIFFVVFLHQYENSSQEQIRQESLAKAELMTQIVDEKFSAVELVANQVSASSWCPYVASNSDILSSRVDYFERKDICSQMGSFNDILQIAASTAVLFPKKNMAVDRVSFWECERYFKSVGLDQGWLEEVSRRVKSDYGAMVLFIQSAEVLADDDFMIAKPLEYYDSPRGVLFVLVDGKQFRKFVRTNMADAFSFSILQNGETVFLTQQESGAGELTKIQLASKLYPWEYCFEIDVSYVGSGLINFNYIILSCLGFLTVAVVIAYLLARLTYRPIARLLEKVGRKKQDGLYGLEEIEHVYEELKVEKEDMEELANQYYQIGQNGFLVSLLMGSYDKEKIFEHVRKFHTDFKADMDYLVIVFINADTKNQEVFMDVMLKLQIDCYHNKIAAVLCSMEERYVMILGAAEGKTVLLHQSERISMLVDEYLSDLDVELYAGKAHAGFKGIHRSWQDVNDKMLKSQDLGGQLSYYYPFDVENRMISQMRNGNFEEAQKILVEVETENARRKVLPEVEKKVTDLIYEGFRRFAADMGILWNVDPGSYRELTEAQDMPGLWEFLRNQLLQIEVSCRESRQFQTLGRSLVKYVDENYASSALSQQDIADDFGVSRPTVSKLFKETVNMNFIDYLHRKRVEHAKQLFKQGNYNVVEVAKQSGYENEVTFKRAFVKNEGITPREYVKRKRMENGGN